MMFSIVPQFARCLLLVGLLPLFAPAEAAEPIKPTAATASMIDSYPSESTVKVTTSTFEAFCNPGMVQSALIGVSPAIVVKEISEDAKLPGGTQFVAATKKVPAYCQVTGSFVTNDKTGKTANFLATFPASWNGKYLQMGCGGHCGTFIANNPASPNPYNTRTQQGYPMEIIIKGYASFSTDEGHDSLQAGSWAIKGPSKVDEDAIADFFYRADQTLARLGKAATIAFYTKLTKTPQKISRSYFSGSSGGGRDAFVAAAYFPEEFDGIIAGSAYINPVGFAFQQAGMAVAAGRSDDAWVPHELIKRIDPIVKAKCDKLDGVLDDLIQNPAACDFRPDRDLPRCDAKTARTECFTDAQIETISTYVTAVTDEDGNVVQPGYSIGELNPSFTLPPKDTMATAPFSESAGTLGLGEATLKVFVHKNDPSFSIPAIISFQSGPTGVITGFHTVVPKAEVATALEAGRLEMSDLPASVANLIKLNRKFLIWLNLSDEVVSPYMTINYYKKAAILYGGYASLQTHIRLFAIPGSGHTNGYAVGPDSFDALTAMENWVERGNAPDTLEAKLFDPDSGVIDPSKKPIRTMPLCKYPEMAHYSGTGDINESRNWSCPTNDASMLTVGESGREAGVFQ